MKAGVVYPQIELGGGDVQWRRRWLRHLLAGHGAKAAKLLGTLEHKCLLSRILQKVFAQWAPPSSAISGVVEWPTFERWASMKAIGSSL